MDPNEDNVLQQNLNAPDCPFMGRCSCWERRRVNDEATSSKGPAREGRASASPPTGSMPAGHAPEQVGTSTVSQHHVKSTLEGRPVEVTAGFDRRMQQFFIIVLDDGPREDECVVYTSLDEPWLDWGDAETLAARLQQLGLLVPATLILELRTEAMTCAGNRIVHQQGGAGSAMLEG